MYNKQTNFKKALMSIFIILVFVSCKKNSRNSDIASVKFQHNGLSREYIYYAPENIRESAPLVVVLHGYTGTAKNIMDYSRMNTIAKENNFAVVYPQGTIDAKSNTFWNIGYDFHSDVTIDDVDYIVKLVQFLQDKYSLSNSNTFLTGMSNGGEMCYLLACKHPEVFNATAPVAGMMLKSFFNDCNSKIAIPVFAIFGTKDDVTNFSGDMNNQDGWGAYQSIPFTIKYWAKSINYASVKTDTLPDLNKIDSSYVVSKKYVNDTTGNEVLFYKVVNGGHDWPGAWGNMDINTGIEIWNFFEKHKN
jgi:polyhydroxybutyrate depolymerase